GIAEVFDAEAQPGNAHVAQGSKLVLLQGARLTLEGDFLGLVPRQQRLQAMEEAGQLRRTEIRWRAAAEVNVVQSPTADDGLPAVEFDFLHQGVEVRLDVARVLVGVDAEVAELAALPAEGNVQVQAQRRGRVRGLAQRGVRIGQVRRLPEGKGRI